MYSKIVFILLVASVFTGLVWAHGNEKHVMGVVKSVGTDSVTVETTSHQSQTVQITAQTKFVKSGAVSSLSDLKAGDKVVIHAKLSGNKLEATEVKFGATPKKSAAAK
jgi:Cu/Ag efflux protein CusF